METPGTKAQQGRLPSAGKWKNRGKSIWANFWFLGPCYILFTVFFFIPMCQSVFYAFTSWDAVNPNITFVGLRNFVKIFTIDSNFLPALGRTFYFTFFNVILTNVLAMLFAVALTTNVRVNNFFRSLLFIPNVISMVITGFIWQFMFLRVIPDLAKGSPGVFGFLNQAWLSDPNLVMFSIVIVAVWQGVGYIMTIYIAGLTSVDASMLEAALIDGAGGWITFWRVKLPAMLPTVAVGAFLNIAGSFKVFDVVYSLTSGGPGRSSEVAMLDIFREAYMYNNFGYACAKSVILALIIIVFTLIQFKFTAGKEVE